MAEVESRGVAVLDSGSGGDTPRAVLRDDLSKVVPLSFLADDGHGDLVLMLTWTDGSRERRPLSTGQLLDMNEKIAECLRRKWKWQNFP